MPLIKSAETEIAQVQSKMDNIMRAVENGMDSEDFGRRYAELKDRRTELNANLDRMKMEHPTLTREQIVWYLKSFRRFGNGSLEEKKRLIDVFVNTIYLYVDGAVDICYNWRPLTERIVNSQWVRLASHSLHQRIK